MSNPTQPYAAVQFLLLDRDTGELKPYMVYPVTKVELKSFTEFGLETYKTFIVEGHELDQKWTEVPK
jgi:hypothetical protein